MARYLLVQVDSNKRASALKEKLDSAGGVETIAIFAKPTEFCQCGSVGNSIRGRKYGWRMCAQCKLPKRTMHYLRNLMDDISLPAKFQDVFLSIEEPYAPPLEKYGPSMIQKAMVNIAFTRAKLSRSASSEARRAARKRRRANRVAHPRRG